MKTALITGITGQDGSNLTNFLLKDKEYKIIGMIRRSSYPNTQRLDHLIDLEETQDPKFKLEYGDVIDFSTMNRLILKYLPDEIYFLSAQSHVAISFQTPISTLEYNTMGYLNLLEIVRTLKETQGYNPKIYFAASSEMFGISPPPQNESTPMLPVSPYGVSKLASFSLGRVYRTAYNMFICNGILFNHSSKNRGFNFVTKKITMGVSDIVSGKKEKLYLGNLTSCRDEGHSEDYVEMMWKMLQEEKPDDYVIATGETHTIEEFVDEAFKLLGLDWKDYVVISDKYKRPFELPALLGDAKKAIDILGFKPKRKFHEIIKEMLEFDLKERGINSIEEAKEIISKW
jgi:GDPmannose 4,6-dehydratase